MQINCNTNRMQSSIKKSALRTIEMEAQSIRELTNSINENFQNAVEALANCKGRVVISGIGKSAIVAQKIVATLNSTGTPAIFMHAADAIHGDIGIVQRDDIVILISKSGSSAEIRTLTPLIKNSGNLLIAIVGNIKSYLAKQANIIIDTTVKEEACPNNLAPTNSTTAQLVMGDAIAICLMEMKDFNSEDFARFHQGGMLGKKLYLRISDIYINNEKPVVLLNQSLKEVIVEMTKKRMGATAVVDEKETLLGIITDGDLRRMLEKNHLSNHVEAKDIMTTHPKTIGPDELAANALDIMRKYEINQLLVISEGKYLGMIHLHDLLKEGFI
jgi:arabinose-5-phosphate isomerase